MKCLSGFLALCILTPVFSWIHRCPPAEQLAPLCTCVNPYTSNISRDVIINCNRLDHAHALSEQLSALKNYIVDGLVIENSGPLDMVDGPFQKLNIHRLTFRNCSFGILPLLSSFNGIQNTLEELTFENCNATRWIRSSGTHFSFLKTIVFTNTNLIPILMQDDFANYPSRVEKITINYCKIKRMEQSALKKFASLKRLFLEDNYLKFISRNSLPPNLSKLIILSLRGNPLETLPNDMFKQMPRLEYLYLGDTKLKTLHQEIFLPVWNQLERVLFNNIWLNCDCNSTWLIPIDWKKLGRSPSCLGLKKPIQEITHQEICPE